MLSLLCCSLLIGSSAKAQQINTSENSYVVISQGSFVVETQTDGFKNRSVEVENPETQTQNQCFRSDNQEIKSDAPYPGSQSSNAENCKIHVKDSKIHVDVVNFENGYILITGLNGNLKYKQPVRNNRTIIPVNRGEIYIVLVHTNSGLLRTKIFIN